MTLKKSLCALSLGILFTMTSACSNTIVAHTQTQAHEQPAAESTASHHVLASNLAVATWNIEHLANPIDAGCRPRNQDEIRKLKAYAQSLNADIVGLQEVGSIPALEMIFPASDWQLLISDRPDSPTYTCRKTGFNSTQQKVAFAVRKGVKVLNSQSLAPFGLNRPGLRYALELEVESDIGPVTLLNVHMKSGCFVDNYVRSDKKSCQTLAKQIPLLDAWIESKEKQGKPYMVLGDFNHRLSAPYNQVTRQLMNNKNGTPSTLENPGRDLIGCNPYYPAPIDHIFVGNMQQKSIVKRAQMHPFDNMDPKAMLSDHCALVLDITKAPLPLSNSVKWQTESKEYRYLTTAIYRHASQALSQRELPDASWVVVMDVDETVLDNSQYQVKLEKSGTSYHPQTWAQWVKSEKATLVPGVKAFIQTVLQRGGKLALITNRNRNLDQYTWRNLKDQGLAVTTQNTCLMGRSAEDKAAMDGQSVINDKDLRRQQIESDSASCYVPNEPRKTLFSKQVILMQVGDNIEDFRRVTQESADVKALVPHSDYELILLPNPMYGSW